jgi:hypothetical protein
MDAQHDLHPLLVGIYLFLVLVASNSTTASGGRVLLLHDIVLSSAVSPALAVLSLH